MEFEGDEAEVAFLCMEVFLQTRPHVFHNRQTATSKKHSKCLQDWLREDNTVCSAAEGSGYIKRAY